MPSHLFRDEPLYVLAFDFTQGLVTKDREQVASCEVSVVTLRSELQCRQNGGFPLSADKIAEQHCRLRFLQRVIDFMQAGFEKCAGLASSKKVRKRANDL